MFRALALCGALLLAFSSAWGQDLNSELALRTMGQWKLLQGEQPQILSCETNERGHLICKTNAELVNVECDAFHFAKTQRVRVELRERGFVCDGTRFEKDSMSSQWQLRLRDRSGRASLWWVEFSTPEQQELAYDLELKGLKERKKLDPGVGHRLGYVFVSSNSDFYPIHQIAYSLLGERFSGSIEVGRNFANSEKAEKVLSTLGFGLNYEKNLGFDGLRGGFALSSGDKVYSGTKAWAHCLGPVARVSALDLLDIYLEPQMCWLERPGFRSAFEAETRTALKIWRRLSLEASYAALLVNGGFESNGLRSEFRLGVSWGSR